MRLIATASFALLMAACAGGGLPSTDPGGPDPAPAPRGRVPPPGPYATGFDALHYTVDLEIAPPEKRLNGRTRIDILLTGPRPDTLRLDLSGMRVWSVATAVGADELEAVGFRQGDGRLFLPARGRPGDTLRVEVRYAGQPDDGLIIGQNLHGAPTVFGDNWPDRARFWFPSIDHPSDKATVEFRVRAPSELQVVANGERIGNADSVRHWRIDQPIPTYLMVIGVARFTTTTLDHCAQGGRVDPHPDGCVPVETWVFPQDSANGARIFRRAPQMLAYYSELIAPYPYERLAHVQSSTIFGGMENAGAIFYSERGVSGGTLGEGTVSHETAHQWFGDAVTPAHWSHLWLSEGFATYFGNLFFEHADGVPRFREVTAESWSGYLGSDVKDLAIVDTLRVPGNDLIQLLNANSYQKGGAVLHMLRGQLGDDVFFAGIRRYYRRHLHGTALTADFRRAMEEEAGRDLGWFFEQWLFRPGHPVLDVTHSWDAASGEAVVAVSQTQKAEWPVFRFPLEIAFTVGGAEVRRRVEMTRRTETFRLGLPGRPDGLRLDPDGWLLHTRAGGS